MVLEVGGFVFGGVDWLADLLLVAKLRGPSCSRH